MMELVVIFFTIKYYVLRNVFNMSVLHMHATSPSCTILIYLELSLVGSVLGTLHYTLFYEQHFHKKQ